MKDNQLIDYVADLQKMKIASLKIEGRMKSADYVYRVAKAYRMVLDNPETLAEAKKILDFDLGRDKTQWFKSNNVNDAITENTVTGKFAGFVSKVEQKYVFIESNLDFTAVRRIRFLDSSSKQQQNFAVKSYTLLGKDIRIEKPDFKIRPGDRVFIAAIKENKFPSQIKDFHNHKKNIAENRNIFSKLNIIKNQQAQQQTKFFMRVDHIGWLKKIHFDSIDALILHLDIKDYENSFLENKFFMKNQHKIWIELPRFISELN
jgi:U32 family peptidase